MHLLPVKRSPNTPQSVKSTPFKYSNTKHFRINDKGLEKFKVDYLMGFEDLEPSFA